MIVPTYRNTLHYRRPFLKILRLKYVYKIRNILMKSTCNDECNSCTYVFIIQNINITKVIMIFLTEFQHHYSNTYCTHLPFLRSKRARPTKNMSAVNTKSHVGPGQIRLNTTNQSGRRNSVSTQRTKAGGSRLNTIINIIRKSSDH